MFSRIVKQSFQSLASKHPNVRYLGVKCSYLEFDEFGAPEEVVKLRTKQLESPKSTQVLVKLLAAPINPADINVIQGERNHRHHNEVKAYQFVSLQENMVSFRQCHSFPATKVSLKSLNVVTE